jgi:hypothetical protein
MVEKRVLFSCICLIFFMLFISTQDLSYLYDDDKCLKPFGLGHDKTIYSFGLIVAIFSTICFFTFSFIDIIYT